MESKSKAMRKPNPKRSYVKMGSNGNVVSRYRISPSTSTINNETDTDSANKSRGEIPDSDVIKPSNPNSDRAKTTDKDTDGKYCCESSKRSLDSNAVLIPFHDFENLRPYGSILEGIGNTPLVSLLKVPQQYGTLCKVFTKCESHNPNGTMCDRIALALINKAEEVGLISPGSILIFGPDPELCASLAVICSIKKYNLLALIPKLSTSTTLLNKLAKHGARIDAFYDNHLYQNDQDSPESLVPLPNAGAIFGNMCIAKAHEYSQVISGSVDLIDFVIKGDNIFDSGIDGIVDEIVRSGVTPDYFVAEKDSLGILNRLSKKLTEKFSQCQVAGIFSEVFPLGSQPDFQKPCEILDTNLVTVSRKDAYRMAQDILEKEGPFCAERGGAVLAGSLKFICDNSDHLLDEDKTLIFVASDGLQYSDLKFSDDEFMLQKGYITEKEIHSKYWWYGLSIGNMNMNLPPYIKEETKIATVSTYLEDNERLIIWNGKDSRDVNNIVGIATNHLFKVVNQHREKLEQKNELENDITTKIPIGKIPSLFVKEFGLIHRNATFGHFVKVLKSFGYVIVYNDVHEVGSGGVVHQFKAPVGIVTKLDMKKWIRRVEDHHQMNSGSLATEDEFEEGVTLDPLEAHINLSQCYFL